MKSYVVVTTILFALILAAHAWRAAVERHLAHEPVFIVSSIIAAGLCCWGAVLSIRSRAR